MDAKVIDLIKLLGCEVENDLWFDEEGVEGTNITLPSGQEIKVYGHDEDIDLDELIEAIKKEVT